MALYLGSYQIEPAVSPVELPNIQSISISQNGTYSISGSVIGYNPIVVNVLPNIQSLVASQSGTYSVSGSVVGYNPVIVEAPGGSLKTVQAYSGTGTMYHSSYNSVILGYSSTITFSNITALPNDFIVMLTPQIYSYGLDYGAVSYWAHTSTGDGYVVAVINVVYNGTSTSTYAFSPEVGVLDETGWLADGTSTYSRPLVSWSYNSNTHFLTYTINSAYSYYSYLYFPTAPADPNWSDTTFSTYPKPAYTLYYH